MKSFCVVTFVIVVLCLCSAVFADVIVVATSSDFGNGGIYDGYLRGRSEVNMSVDTAYLAQFSNNMAPFWVTALASGMDGDIVLGTNHGQIWTTYPWAVRDTKASGTKFTYGAYSGMNAIITLPNGNVVFGTDHDWYPNVPEDEAEAWWPGRVMVLDRTDLTQPAPDYNSPTDVVFYAGVLGTESHTDVTALGAMSNGYVVIGDSNGVVYVRSGTDLYSSIYVPDVVDFGADVNVVALAVTNDKIVIAYGDTGDVTVRSPDDLTVSLSDVDFGSQITRMLTMPNGLVAIGFDNGQVEVRDPNADVSVDLGMNIDLGSKIEALAVSASGHLVIGTNNNRVYIRSQDDLDVIPEVAGFGSGSDEYYQMPGDPNYVRISALAVYSPDSPPATCLEARHGGYRPYGDFNGDCRVDFKDINVYANNWMLQCGYWYYDKTIKQVRCFCGDNAVEGAVIDVLGYRNPDTSSTWSGYVDLPDLARFTEDWLLCVDPLDMECDHAWE